jgi:hypothetical protein
MSATALAETAFEVSDVTGQRLVAVKGVDPEATVAELIQGLLDRMRLPPNDTAGRPLSYQARSDREGRHLHGTEKVKDTVQPGDRLTLQPNVDAGRGRPGGRG